MTIDEQEFKQVMAKWASGITVVTTRSEEGSLKGMTASSFCSVSKNPPLVLVCIAKRLYTHQVIEHTSSFAINILSVEQEYWGKLFAGLFPEVDDRWAGIEHMTAITGCPILPDTLGWIDCRLYKQVEAGDHSIFIGEILAAKSNENNVPLMYFNRQWGTFVSRANSLV